MSKQQSNNSMGKINTTKTEKTNYFLVEIQKPKKKTVYQFTFTGLLIIYRCVNKQFFVHTPLCTKKKKGIICKKDCIIKHDTKSCKTSTKLNVSLTENHWQMQMVLKNLFFFYGCISKQI